mmetsp:Transcript_8811/g.6551  ORF Transcript_8811/g.6551 Transcript_8811/m.6551 type:complete len:101 (-) Transcript_8811:342-644(-)
MLKVYKLENQYSSHINEVNQSKTRDSDEGDPDYEEEKDSKGKPDGRRIANMLNCEGAKIQGINTMALMSRLELYVDKDKWLNSSKFTKIVLNSFISESED